MSKCCQELQHQHPRGAQEISLILSLTLVGDSPGRPVVKTPNAGSTIPGLGTKSHMPSGVANIYIYTFFGWVSIYICLERKPDKCNYLSSPNSSTLAHG